jgi:hypothetical protein
MYESKKHPPLSRSLFLVRILKHLVAILVLLFVSLLLGITGYVIFEHLSLTDAFLNASMLLGGMGPVNMPVTAGGKIFAGIYALYSGLVFILSAAVIFTPVLHRVLHKFHSD